MINQVLRIMLDRAQNTGLPVWEMGLPVRMQAAHVSFARAAPSVSNRAHAMQDMVQLTLLIDQNETYLDLVRCALQHYR